MRFPCRWMFTISLISILSITLLAIGCGQSAPPPAPTQSPSAVTKPAQPSAPSPSATAAPKPAPSPVVAKQINLKYSCQNPEGGWGATNASIPWLKSIEEATKGRVKITTYFSETLSKGAANWESVKNGVAEMGWMSQTLMTNMQPLGEFSILPALPYKSSEQASGIFWQMMEKFPALKNQYKDIKVLASVVTSPYFLITSKKQVKAVEDMKGLKLRVAGGPPTDMMKVLGVAPLVVGMADTYLNLQKGVMDGMATCWEALISFRQYEVVKYYTYYPCYSGYFIEAMNWDAWKSLPPDVQQAIESVSGLKGSQFLGKNFYDTSNAAGAGIAKKGGYPMEEYNPTATELQRWTDTAKPIWEQWIKNMGAKGYTDAQAILDTALDLIKTYKP